MRASPLFDLAGPVALVCHDAGAANLLISWLASGYEPRGAFAADVSFHPYMAGPAATLWQRAFPDRPLLGSIDDALKGAMTLVSGTGWATDIEHRSRVNAAAMGVRSLAVIDHWTNYAARFERDGVTCLPDTLIVSDGWAKALAGKTFPALPIVQWPNSYLDSQVADIAPVPTDGDILYICEPARSNWGRERPGEFQAIDFFIQHLPLTGWQQGDTIRIRPHPSEEPQKYDAIVTSYDYLSLDDSASLAGSINKAKVVVGMNSAAMVVALAAGRSVVSTLPPWAPPCALPHDGIVHLRELAAR